MDNLCLEPPDHAQTDRIQIANQIQHRLRRVHQRASALFLDSFGDAQLTPTQWAVLATLLAEGSLSQNQLGRLTYMDPATTQGVIIRLMERQLVVRYPDPVDRRRTSVQLTANGEMMVRRFSDNSINAHNETLKPLTAEEQDQFMALLARLM